MELNKNFQLRKTMKRLLIMNYIATVISNISSGYIHQYWTDPPTCASYGKCMGRCSIKSKNNGGNIISSFKPFNVINIQLAGAYISKEMIVLRECIPHPFWQQIMKS
jgi:hypothetical protein